MINLHTLISRHLEDTVLFSPFKGDLEGVARQQPLQISSARGKKSYAQWYACRAKFFPLLLFILVFLLVLSSVSYTFAQNTLGQQNFIYLKNQAIVQTNALDLLRQNIVFAKQKQFQFARSQVFFLEKNNKNFLLAQIQNIAGGDDFARMQQDIKALERFTTVEILEYLQNKSNRKKALQDYIAKGNMLLSQSNSQSNFLQTQKESLGLQIKKNKTDVKNFSSEYKKLLKNFQSQIPPEALEIQKDIVESSKTLAHVQTEYEKISTLEKHQASTEKILQDKITAAEENFDALVHNIRVKTPSGEFIKVIEK